MDTSTEEAGDTSTCDPQQDNSENTAMEEEEDEDEENAIAPDETPKEGFEIKAEEPTDDTAVNIKKEQNESLEETPTDEVKETQAIKSVFWNIFLFNFCCIKLLNERNLHIALSCYCLDYDQI